MPKLMDVIEEVIKFSIPKRAKKAKSPQPTKEAICVDALVIYEWLLKHKGQIPFFCLMLQEGLESSFLLEDDGEPAIFKEWQRVDRERENMSDSRVWILEFEGEPN